MRNRPTNRGFTLIEVIIAVMILAFSLTTLLGLQSSSTDQAIRTRNKQQAMLMARKIMSSVELQGSLIKPMKLSADANQVLERFLMADPSEKKKKSEKTVAGLPLNADIAIEFWNMEGLPEKSVLKIALVVSWSPNPADSVEVLYFVPAELE